SWLHVAVASASGTGDALVLFTYDANGASTARTGTITIAGVTLTVVQAGVGYLTAGPSTNTTIALAGLSHPSGITADSAGNAYFSDNGNNAVKKWTAATGQVSTIVTGLNG